MLNSLFSKINSSFSVKSLSTPVMALYLLKYNENKTRLIIFPEQESALKLLDTIQAFKPNSGNFIFFPEWDSKPEYQTSPSIDVQSRRLFTLFKVLNSHEPITIISSVSAIAQVLPPTEYLSDFSEIISVDKEIDIDALSLRLVSSGYQKADLVTTQGAFSLKGNIIDIFPASQELPVRIELFGDIVETIKTFDPTTQRSVEQIQKTYITPVREISFSEESLNIFKDRIKEYCDQNSIRKDLRLQTIELIDNSLYFPGVEYYLPFFYNKTSTIYDYLSENDEIINVDDYLFNPDPIEQGHDPDEETIPFPTKDLFIEKEQILELMEKKKTKAFYSIEFETDSENDKITFSLKDKAWNQALIKHEINNAKRENKDFLDVIKQHHLLNKENGRSTV